MAARLYESVQLTNPSKGSSASRVDKMFEQFQNFKNRVRSSSRRKTERNLDYVQDQEPSPNKTSIAQQNTVSKRGISEKEDWYLKKRDVDRCAQRASRIEKDQHKKDKIEGKQNMLANLDMNHKIWIQITTVSINTKVDDLEKKLKRCEQVIKTLGDLVKKNKEKQANWGDLEKKKLADVKKEYESKIKSLTKTYEQKLKKSERDSTKEKKTCSTIQKSFQKQINQFESLFLSKNHEIAVLQQENAKLRKTQDLILNNSKINKKKIEELEFTLKKQSEEINKLNVIIHIKQKKIEELETKLLAERDSEEKEVEIQIPQRRPLFKELSHDAQSEMLQGRNKLDLIQRMKMVNAEADFLQEQNKYLESKKHFYEVQQMNSEMDEERFQMQSNLYKKEIKSLTKNVKILEEIFLSLITKGEIKAERVDELSEDLRIKKYFKENNIYKFKFQICDK